MKRFVEGEDRRQAYLLPESLDDYVAEDNPVRVVEVFIDELDLGALGLPTPATALCTPTAPTPSFRRSATSSQRRGAEAQFRSTDLTETSPRTSPGRPSTAYAMSDAWYSPATGSRP